MPELMDGAILLGIVAAILARAVYNSWFAPRRLHLIGMILAAVVGAYVGPPLFHWVAAVWRAIPILPTITFGAAYIGVFVGAAVFFIANQKNQPRRVPGWAATLIGVVAILFLPPLLDRVTGSYQNASLRADVNRCTEGMTGQIQPNVVRNICAFDITVGLCMPGEMNPEPCAQSITLRPGGETVLDPGGAQLSSVPASPGGFTVVACRTPERASRWGNVTGRGYRGVCLPPG